MVTDREREILMWIKENPLLSQEELARRAGITRSSIAVHISNLMRKGMIIGKGYVLSEYPYVVVIGGVNMDIMGCPEKHLISKDSNPGHVELSLGGVGRNQANNLKLLGIDVKFVTAFGEDFYAEKIQNNCRELGIDITQAVVTPNGKTSTYLSIIDENGVLKYGISDMEITKFITPSILESRMNIINKACACLVETNLSEDALLYLAEHCKVPLFAETISITKASRLRNILDKIHTLRANCEDLQAIIGYKILTKYELEKAVQLLLDKGIRRVFVSMNPGLVCYGDDSGISWVAAYEPSSVENVTGVRDSFMAALIWAFMSDFTLSQSAVAGLTAAHICMESKHAVNEKLSEETIFSLMNKMSVEIHPRETMNDIVGGAV
jgi:pseudouridine kinase